MQDNKMSEIMRSSLDGIRSVADVECAVGQPINTPSGVTVIPVSKVSFGFATGGIDIIGKKIHEGQNFGGGGGSGVSITPLAFLTIGTSGEVNLVSIEEKHDRIDKIVKLVEHAPDLIEKIKKAIL